ncbi:hypothetical protein SSTU70S_05727 [Stutzerimonas stutzeri]
MADLGTSRSQLETSSIAARWSEVSASLARLVSWMDSRESWVVEPDEEFLDLLAQVIDRVEQPAFASELENGDNAARLAEVFAVLHSSRFLRVLEMIDRRMPGLVSRLTLALGRLGGESELFANLFYERMLVIHRFELLGQVFSVKRCQSIADSIRLIKEANQ